MKTKMYLMANDSKWVMNVRECPFVPFTGMDVGGLADEQPVRVSGVEWNIPDNFIKLRLSWLSSEPLTSQQLYDLNVGWEAAAK